jgi:hypothetical protein
VRYEEFKKYDAVNMAAIPMLYQAGYLTIVDFNHESNLFRLDYPNDEVRAAFAGDLTEKYLHVPGQDLSSFIARFTAAIYGGDIDGIMASLKPFFASIPYDLIVEKENYYQTAVHLIFTMLGLQCRSEVRISDGRIDTLVETNNFVYCFEFKLNGTAKAALNQINSKDYLLPWQGSSKKLFKVGVNFDHEKRGIDKWLFDDGSVIKASPRRK